MSYTYIYIYIYLIIFTYALKVQTCFERWCTKNHEGFFIRKRILFFKRWLTSRVIYETVYVSYTHTHIHMHYESDIHAYCPIVRSIFRIYIYTHQSYLEYMGIV